MVAGRRGYRDLIAWQKAMDLVTAVYQVANDWPEKEQRGLVNQICRAAISVPSNIAEGQGRSSGREFLHHLSIANGSLYEVETQLLISRNLGYTDGAICDRLLAQSAEVARVLHGLMESKRASLARR